VLGLLKDRCVGAHHLAKIRTILAEIRTSLGKINFFKAGDK